MGMGMNRMMSSQPSEPSVMPSPMPMMPSSMPMMPSQPSVIPPQASGHPWENQGISEQQWRERWPGVDYEPLSPEKAQHSGGLGSLMPRPFGEPEGIMGNRGEPPIGWTPPPREGWYPGSVPDEWHDWRPQINEELPRQSHLRSSLTLKDIQEGGLSDLLHGQPQSSADDPSMLSFHEGRYQDRLGRRPSSGTRPMPVMPPQPSVIPPQPSVDQPVMPNWQRNEGQDMKYTEMPPQPSVIPPQPPVMPNWQRRRPGHEIQADLARARAASSVGIPPVSPTPPVMPRPGIPGFGQLPTGREISSLTSSDAPVIRPPSIQLRNRRHGGSLTHTVLAILKSLS
mgnify:CR=1 FL=1